MQLRVSCLLAVLLAVAAGPIRADRMTPELLWKLGRLEEAALSPDGGSVAYLVRRFDLAANQATWAVHAIPLAGGQDRIVADGLASASDLQWVARPEGPRLFLAAARERGAKSQAWSIDPATGAFVQVTNVAAGIANLEAAPRGDRIAFTSDVRLDPEIKDSYPDLPLADGRIFDGLMFRHWNAWSDGTFSHLFVADLGPDGVAGEPRDLLRGLRFHCPPPPFGSRSDFDWSPDGEEIAFSAKMVQRPAESTDTDIYLADTSGEERLLCVTAGMDGHDAEPHYSPDGRSLAFVSLERPGFEADRGRIFIFERGSGALSEATAGLDRSAHGLVWGADSRSILFTSEEKGTEQIYRIDLGPRAVAAVTSGRFNWGVVAVSSGDAILASRIDMLRPAELFVLEPGGPRGLTDINGEIYRTLELPRVEERWVRSTDGKKVHCWVILPPDFPAARGGAGDAITRWPLLTYCQGGPQSQIGQGFSYRWNFHLMAASGYVVLAPNRRGLPGFGQAWNDQISRDWGGQAMQDILACSDSMLVEPFIDPRRAAAVGASFGGYTVYWLMGHHEGRFSAMIAHCGVFNLESMYGSTEEIYFADWDLGGPYWRDAETADRYARFSPHRFAGRWRTPLLVIHGEKDFRVPLTQGIEAFTAAQLEGVPSRFLYFPSEGHWVLSPQNSVLWQRVFFDWLERSIGSGPRPGL